MNKTKRAVSQLGFFNLARGCGILFVLLGHSINIFLPQLAAANTATITAVHAAANATTGIAASAATNAAAANPVIGSVIGGGVMAMFFFISGYGFFDRKIKKCISIQCKLLLKPYAVTAACILAAKALLAMIRQRSFLENGGEYILTFLLGLNAEGGGTFLGFPVESVSIFWFVLSLMNGWIVLNAIRRLKNKKLQKVLIAACLLGGYALTYIRSVWPFCLPTSLMTVAYLAFGKWMKENAMEEKKLSGIESLDLILPAAISFFAGNVDMIKGTWGLGLIDVYSTFAIGFLLVRLFVRIGKMNLKGKVITWIEAAGFNSIWIICIHAFEKIVFPWYRLGYVFAEHPVIGIAVCMILRCLLIFAIYQAVMKLRRIRWKSKKKKQTTR